MYSGHSAISPDFLRVVLHSFDDGIHAYNISGGRDHLKRCGTYKLDSPPRSRHALQVAFVQEGRAIVAGTTTGKVCVWQAASGEYFQQLEHDGECVAALCVPSLTSLSEDLVVAVAVIPFSLSPLVIRFLK